MCRGGVRCWHGSFPQKIIRHMHKTFQTMHFLIFFRKGKSLWNIPMLRNTSESTWSFPGSEILSLGQSVPAMFIFGTMNWRTAFRKLNNQQAGQVVRHAAEKKTKKNINKNGVPKSIRQVTAVEEALLLAIIQDPGRQNSASTLWVSQFWLQGGCHIWVDEHPFTIYLMFTRCQGFDPLPYLLLMLFKWPSTDTPLSSANQNLKCIRLRRLTKPGRRDGICPTVW